MSTANGTTRQHLAGTNGPEYWRGLEEWLDTEEFRTILAREFPDDDADKWTDPVTRRQFVMMAGASLALAGVAGCSPRPAPAKKIHPYVNQPEGITPGIPLYFATAVTHSGYAMGVLVKSYEGRPIKIEGNPNHPASLGSTDAFMQAAVLGLYDPDRSQLVLHKGQPSSWDNANTAVRTAIDAQRGKSGAGLRILTETITSPTLAAQIGDVIKELPQAKWVQYEPVHHDNAAEGSRLAFNEVVNPIYDFTKADVVVSLDADFVNGGPASVRYWRDFSSRRRFRTDGSNKQNRLYTVECLPSGTGAISDHRLPLKRAEVEAFARDLAAELGIAGASRGAGLAGDAKAWITAIAKDLKAVGTAAVVVAGPGQPAAVHAIAHAINDALKSAAVRYTQPVESRPVMNIDDLRVLVDDLNKGQVETLIILGGNPVFTAPADFKFAEALSKAKNRFHLSQYQDETSALCDWHINEAHSLETWGDARAFDGTATVMQPLIAPLYAGHSAIELLAAALGKEQHEAREIVRDYWRGKLPSGDFETNWQKAVQAGVVEGTTFPNKSVTSRLDWNKAVSPSLPTNNYEVGFAPDPTIYDGRFANYGWLQELPKPVTKLTWDNAAIISPKTAVKLGVTTKVPDDGGGEHGRANVHKVELTYRGQKLVLPAWIQPGHADDAVTLHFGYGRDKAGRVGNGTGFNVYKLRTSTAPWMDGGLDVVRTGEGFTLACVQISHAIDIIKQTEIRKPVRHSTQEAYKTDPYFAKLPPVAATETGLIYGKVPGSPTETKGDIQREFPIQGAPNASNRDHDHKDEEHKHDKRLMPLTLYPDTNKEGSYRWAMAIDLTTCTGCNVCTIACMAENNITVVGKKEVTRGREMYWIRVDRYYEGNPDDSSKIKIYFQPLPCMQCEKAPCELVCPVAATVHSHDGLNDMVYNRCVGTRYCSNNCPYKVRRFNFLAYADFATESMKLQRNPEVSVRSRGVMEKCTYCVQRIRSAEIEAQREGRQIQDGEIVTACQAACPANAIVFGDLQDKGSEVVRWKNEPTNYALLGELNTMPRTTYLATIRNPNPELKGALDMASGTLAPGGGIPDAPLIGGNQSLVSVGDTIADISVGKRGTPRQWWYVLGVAFLGLNIFLVAVTWLLYQGPGVWGLNIPVAWGFAIINFVWWIGIGHAGTLISAILLLLHQKWRTSINRFSESMTLFAVMCAGMFPILHMGRWWFAYWLYPYPNTMGMPTQFRSPLEWDVFAVSTYFTVSLIFWYIGLIPDLASIRDRAPTKLQRIIYGFFALGWRGSALHWRRYEKVYLLLAGLCTPLVLSVHTVVSFDFAVALVPLWHATIFPPFFVAGAIFSGFAMVLFLAIPARKWFGLENLITRRHLDNCAKVMLGTGMLVCYGYFSEVWMAWYGHSTYEWETTLQRIKDGPYAWSYWALITCNFIVPQVLWSKRIRYNDFALMVVSVVVLLGMWYERYVIVITLTREYLPSGFGSYSATIFDWGLFIGTLGFFFFAFALFCRFLPMISIAEMRELLPHSAGGRDGHSIQEGPP